MVKLHISDPAQKLSNYFNLLHRATELAIARTQQLITVSSAEVILYPNSRAVIPEVGVSGISPSGSLALIALDPDNKNFASSYEVELPAIVAHELHHCLRSQIIGFGNTLFEVLITEGLARDLEREFRGGKLPSYQPTFEDSINDLWLKASSEADSEQFSYNDWFFGSRERNIPRFAGYALGLWIVDIFKARFNYSFHDLARIPSSNFRSCFEQA